MSRPSDKRGDETARWARSAGLFPSRNAPVIHQCPPKGEGKMPCCGRIPFEAGRFDRISTDPRLVTCKPNGRPNP